MANNTLQANLDNFQGICKENLTPSCHAARQNFPREFNFSSFGILQPPSDEVIHGELDSLFRRDCDKKELNGERASFRNVLNPETYLQQVGEADPNRVLWHPHF